MGAVQEISQCLFMKALCPIILWQIAHAKRLGKLHGISYKCQSLIGIELSFLCVCLCVYMTEFIAECRYMTIGARLAICFCHIPTIPG